MEQNLTPMMKQWYELKAQAAGALLFFRLGDFYELFEDDAVRGAPILGVTLTARNHRGSQSSSSALCGVPVAHLELYLNRALDHGLKVALAEQMELPTAGKTIVRREIVQWFTPGMRLLPNEDRSHYLAIVSGTPDHWTLAAADIGTGHLVLESGAGLEALQDQIDLLPIEDLRTESGKGFDLKVAYRENIFLLSHLDAEAAIVKALSLVSFEDSPTRLKLETQTLGTLLDLLAKSHPRERLKFHRPSHDQNLVWMTSATRRNLNLFETQSRNFFQFFDETKTALGRRALKSFLTSPTQDVSTIQSRQSIIAFFKTFHAERKTLRSQFAQIQDLHRLIRRKNTPQKLLQLATSLEASTIAAQKIHFAHFEIEEFKKANLRLRDLSELLHRSIQASENGGMGWIQSGVSAELDELRKFQQSSEGLLAQLEETLRAETKISGLKIKFHQVFGYVAEVTALHKDKIPAHAKRIQTLANAERFKTLELESLEEKILSLESRITEAERGILQGLYARVEKEEALLTSLADRIGKLDAYQSMAEISQANGWATPTTRSSGPMILKVEQGVHPLASQGFVPLSFSLLADSSQIILLTGPNMAGKSTLLRMAALVSLLHQIGSDVPAASSELSIFDRIVCRMGAADDLGSGQSTFFVEMREVASMLDGATSKSLLLFDEIGRGTSTFDGMSLAWAITEAVHDLQCLSLIATHYLELSELEKSLSRIQNFHLGIREIDGRLVFTRKLEAGAASRSYGIHVAKLAHLPPQILERADQKLKEFERRRSQAKPLVLEVHA